MRASLIGVATLLAAAGCSTGDPTLPSDPGASTTGTFPTFSAVPAAAGPQLEADQAEGDIASLERAAGRAQRRAGMPTTDADRTLLQRDAAVRRAMVGMSEVERLRFLRRVHEERTLAQIDDGTS